MSTVLLLIAGLVLLIAGAEILVRGASRLAAAAGISPLVIGSDSGGLRHQLAGAGRQRAVGLCRPG